MAGIPDISALATYGGALSNYNGQAVVNPLTDRDAAAALSRIHQHNAGQHQRSANRKTQRNNIMQ